MDGRHVIVLVLAAAATLSVPRTAAAQPPQWPEKFWVSVSGGVEPAPGGFTDTFRLPLYTEQEQVAVDYRGRTGALVAAGGGCRVWKRLALGIGVTHYSGRAPAGVDARLPHPFFDNQFREVSGTVDATRSETGAHFLIGWMVPLTDRLRLILTAGPSAIGVRQTLVTDVRFAETFPFDTAEFTGAETRNATNTAIGFNAGADVFWMFTRRLGAGALVQFSHARAKTRAGDHSVSVDAGGAQAAAGLRIVF
jgi:hypothetical protein